MFFLFIGVGVWYVKPDNWTPFMPFGFSGVATGAATVFFAYIGFDAVSTAAEEVKKIQSATCQLELFPPWQFVLYYILSFLQF
ncbi:hypothetical protein GCM10020331_051360 [Ectobacillus funiculus]